MSLVTPHYYSRNGTCATCVRCGHPKAHASHVTRRRRVAGKWARWFRHDWKVY